MEYLLSLAIVLMGVVAVLLSRLLSIAGRLESFSRQDASYVRQIGAKVIDLLEQIAEPDTMIVPDDEEATR